MSGIRQHRASSSYIAYPAQILDDTILEAMGLLWGVRTEEVPPKVVMNRADWSRLLRAIRNVTTEEQMASPKSPHRAVLFLGKSWRDNPLIDRSANEPVPPRPKKRVFPAKKPGPFAHLTALPVPQGMAKACLEHEIRVKRGEDEGASRETLKRALEAIKKAALNHVEPRPLPAIEGDEPPSPSEMRRGIDR